MNLLEDLQPQYYSLWVGPSVAQLFPSVSDGIECTINNPYSLYVGNSREVEDFLKEHENVIGLIVESKRPQKAPSNALWKREFESEEEFSEFLLFLDQKFLIKRLNENWHDGANNLKAFFQNVDKNSKELAKDIELFHNALEGVNFESGSLAEEISSKCGLNIKVYDYSIEELANDPSIIEENFWVPIREGARPRFLVVENYSMALAKDYWALLLIIGYQHYTNLDQVENLNSEWMNYLEKIYHFFPMPLALFSEPLGILSHNSEFSNLGLTPSKCKDLIHGEYLEQKGKSYYVFLQDVSGEEEGLRVLVLIGQNQKGIYRPSEELGIVCSSLAHELNNPLGGIMAAISVLCCEEDLQEEHFKALEEMMDGAKRAKQLVEIFLGFSRTSKTKSQHRIGTLWEAFSFAVDMMKTRVMESDIRIEVTKTNDGQFEMEVNLAMLAMVFYLFLSEAMTEVSHYQLMSGEESKSLKIEYKEGEQRLDLTFSQKIPFESIYKNSRLIKYLLDFENVRIDVVDGQLSFLEWGLQA